MAKRKKNDLKNIMEMLNFYGAREITDKDLENNPGLKRAIESDRRWLREHTIIPKRTKKTAIVK